MNTAAFGLIAFLSLAVGASSARVRVHQFSMAKCPMTSSWVARFAEEFMSDQSLRAIVDFDQSYVGGPVGEGPVNATSWSQCFHGPSECQGHTIMLCAKNVSRSKGLSGGSVFDYRWFDLVNCMGGKGGLPGVTYGHGFSIPESAKGCAAKVGLDWGTISSCAAGEQGAQLLHDSHFKTMEMFAEHGGYTPEGHGYRPPLIPSIWIYEADGGVREYNNPLVNVDNPYADITARVCAAYTEEKPAACTYPYHRT